MSRLQEIKKHLCPGRVYCREDLATWSNAVDRHLKQLREEGKLTKLSGGLNTVTISHVCLPEAQTAANGQVAAEATLAVAMIAANRI